MGSVHLEDAFKGMFHLVNLPAVSIGSGGESTELESLPCEGRNQVIGERRGRWKRIDESKVREPGLYMTCRIMGCRAIGNGGKTVPGVFA